MAVEGERVLIRGTKNWSWLRWGIATLVVVAGMEVYFVVTDPSSWPWVAVTGVPIALLVWYLTTTRLWLEPDRGVFVEAHFGFLRREIPLPKMTEVKFVDNRAGGLLLGMRRPGRRRRYLLSLLVISDYGGSTVLAEYLRLYADQLERWVPAQARGDVVAGLRKQVAHLESGGSVEDSPLAKLVTRTISNVAKAGGAAGSTGLFK